MYFGKNISFHTFFKECEPFTIEENGKLPFTRTSSLNLVEPLGIVDVRHCLHFGKSLKETVVFLNQRNWKRGTEYIWKEKGIDFPVFAFVDQDLEGKEYFEEPQSFPWVWVEDTYALLTHICNKFQNQFVTSFLTANIRKA